jgi:hypothetical protein
MRVALVYQYDPTATGPGGEPEIQEWLDLDAQVRGTDGTFVYAAGFYGVDAARSVSVHNGSTTVLDGVGAVAGEVVAGMLVIDVPDLDTAVTWAAKIPTARYGSVQVRQLVEFEV